MSRRTTLDDSQGVLRRMRDIEIPAVHERGRRYRLIEAVPGLLSWSLVLLPLGLGRLWPELMVPASIGLVAGCAVASIGVHVGTLRGLRAMRDHVSRPWERLLRELEDRHEARARPAVAPSELVHAVIVATWNESREVLEPTVRSLVDSRYDLSRVIFVLAYERRGGPDVERRAHQLVSDHGGAFGHAMAVRHDDGPGEVVGKGANITAAGRELARYVVERGIEPERVVVTTLDADNRPHPDYLAALTYAYCAAPDPVRASFQPIPLYTSNVWDAPAPIRVIALTSSLWNVGLSVRPRLVRNFSSHSQSLRALVDMDFWSVRTVVEDGHQFWRSYFWHDGRYTVHPVPVPIYQDAVLAVGYRRTLRAQFVQLRRWAWGVSDVAYVAEHGYFRANSVPKADLTVKFLRLLVGHVGWAAAPLVLASFPVVAAVVSWDGESVRRLAAAAGTLRAAGLVGAAVALVFCVQVLPPRPAHHRRRRWVLMVLQWGLVPVTTIAYNASAALTSQTRLMLGRRLERFDLTEKAVVTPRLGPVSRRRGRSGGRGRVRRPRRPG